MTSKQRVLNAFRHEKSDRVPFDIFLNGGILSKLYSHYHVNDYDKLLEKMDIDFRGYFPAYKGKPLFKRIEGLNVDPVYGFYTRWVEHGSGGYWDFCGFPLQGADSETIAAFPVPSPDDFDYSNLEPLLKIWKDKAVYVGNAGICDIINATGRVMGMEDTLVNLLSEDEATLIYINKRLGMELGVIERVLNKAKGKVDFVWMGEDLGTQIAPMISLDLYRRVFRPMHQKVVDLAKSFKLPVMMHTCGSSSWAYEDFIEMGIDCVDTLQPEAANMSPGYLVKRFAGRLAFHGCISTAGPLAYGTPADVEKNVKETLAVMMPTKSYMFSPTHAIQDNTPLENVLKMYEAGAKYGKY